MERISLHTLSSLFWLLMLALTGSGCADPADRKILPDAEQVQRYEGTWEYRYGDSPRRPDGTFEWADPKHDDGGWRPTQTTSSPPGRGKNNHLWLRTRLLGPPLRDPVLRISLTNQSYEAYLDGRLFDHFGHTEGKAAEHFPGRRPAYLHLGDDYAGRMLVLRVYSPSRFLLGVSPVQRLGGNAEQIVDMIKRGLPEAMTGAVLIVAGLCTLTLFLVRRTEIIFLLYALSSLILGTYIVSWSSAHPFLVEEPSVWYYVELGSLCLTGAPISALVSHVLGQGFLGSLKWLSRSFLAYFVVSVLLLVTNQVPLLSLFSVLQYLWLLAMLVIIAHSAVEAWRGNSDARILSIGFLIAACIGVYELLQNMGILSRRLYVVHYLGAVLMVTLAVVIARRFQSVHRRLADYSHVLQLSFSSAQDLSPGHQAQLVLAELLRMLSAERALIFLCKPGGEELELVAGRDAQDNVLLDPAKQGSHDEKLVAAVIKKRRPLVREFAVASPLLARGQLLGVLYMEATRRKFGREEVEILLGLGNQVALTLMATRAGKLESETAKVRERLQEQETLLAAAARMARGELQTPIAVPEASELLPLSRALDNMRRDLLVKIHMLESSNAAIQQLNDEMRYQIAQRLRRLIDRAEQRGPDLAPPPSATALAAGDLLAENYRVVSLLGEGSTGSVYEVERLADGRRLAAKVVQSRADKKLLLHFAREAEILARLSHPNVVSIVDVDITTSGGLFLVTELVRGLPLHQLQNRYGNRDFAMAVLWQVAAGLRIVHERGIIHRDLKPANVLIAQHGVGAVPQVKLVDFGVSTLSQSDTERSGSRELSIAGQIVGTPMYLAPELAEGSHKASPASDIFSFGVIAYELLTQEMPFTEPPVATRWRGEALSITSISKKHPGLVQSLGIPAVTLLDLCLSSDPSARPSAADLLGTLDAPLNHPGPAHPPSAITPAS